MRNYFLIWVLLASGFAMGQSQNREVYMCKETTIRLTAESVGAFKYEWFRDNKLLLDATTSELAVSEEGTYKVVGVNIDGCISEESVYIVVTHHKPTAVNDVTSGKVNKDLLIDVLKNDVSTCADLDINTLLLINPPPSGVVTKVGGKLNFTPALNFSGKLSFTYSVRDRAGQLSNTAKVDIEIITDPLPVTLAYFEVKKSEATTILNWETSEESNSDHFDVQRSTDMQHWRSLFSVKAAFASKVKTAYDGIDSLPESGLNYYRLKMVDADSSFSFSRVRSVHFPELSWAEVYPNPVEDLLHIVIRNKKVKNIRLIRSTGVVELSKAVTDSAIMISMKHMATGIYFIHFEQEDGAVKIFKVMHT